LARVRLCDNIRIRRCRLYQGEAYRGRIASKRRYFYGLRVHLLVTAAGEPVEFFLSAGARHDLVAFREFGLELPEGSTIHAVTAKGFELKIVCFLLAFSFSRLSMS
jgi:hypothetical protein